MAATAATVAALCELPGMERLSEDQLRSLADHLQLREFATGDVILRAGDPGRSVHLVLDGDVEVSTGTGVQLARQEAGTLVGAVAFVRRGPRTATCTAATTVRTAELSEETADLLFTVDPAIGVALELALGAQLGRDYRATSAALTRLLAEH